MANIMKTTILTIIALTFLTSCGQQTRQNEQQIDNPFIQSFNGSFRDECLNTNWFLSLSDARDKIESFRRDYNSYRPHSSLQGMTPEEVEIEYVKNPEFSTFELSEKWE